MAAATVDKDAWRRTYYETIREEILQHKQQRDRISLLLIAAVATLAGVAVDKQEIAWKILLIVPLIGLAAALQYVQHNRMVRRLARYLAVDICHANKLPPSWEASDRRAATKQLLSPASISALATFGLLPLAALLTAWLQWRSTSETDWRVAFALGGAFVVFSFWSLVSEFHHRNTDLRAMQKELGK